MEVSDDPDWMVAAFGSLWVLRGDGEVHRIDPKTGDVVAEIDPGRFQEPLCYDDQVLVELKR